MAHDSVTRALIPAAGRGTRFLPFTKAMPKELLPIVSTPTLEIVIGEAARNEITDVVVVLSPGKGMIADYFSPNPDLEQALKAKGDQKGIAAINRAAELVSISYAEQVVPRGLGDAVAHGEEFANGGPLAVLLPDDLVDDRDDVVGAMRRVYAEHGGIVLGLMEVPRSEISKYGCVAPIGEAQGDVIAISDLVEKPAPEAAPSLLAIIGRYVLPPEIFDAIRRTEPGAGGEIQLTDAMRLLAGEGVPVHGVVFRGRRYDTGDKLDYVRAVVQLARRHPDIGEQFNQWLVEYVSEIAAETNPGVAQ
ncbi:UDP-glucose pyrophosphorylase [Jatrophihabitans sp. GAS493]|uniref:UTP--glucose-1-phosphate uridylyltransferase n=1 Tax=Jatrophihabitans sp. GAS493 TaxID=1907575 RepID=UPI000BB9004E|nr:UTP--glucose-1-phosphate uridylyltransferase [Jatrophihabitans sp. GAS493]SOD72508.1 UDP-glucose pyrophosphorylase [Jatrophihabitans sp. GAS493]